MGRFYPVGETSLYARARKELYTNPLNHPNHPQTPLVTGRIPGTAENVVWLDRFCLRQLSAPVAALTRARSPLA